MRMSLRTTPLSVRTLGPFEPSPGYGPAVSWGIRLLQVLPVPPVVTPPVSLGAALLSQPRSGRAASPTPSRAAIPSRLRRSSRGASGAEVAVQPAEVVMFL